jgi:RimJ/RimL family protein N-acetyltransferase
MMSLPITTERLILRDFRDSDFKSILAYASDPEVTRLMFYGPRDEADTRSYLNRMLETQSEKPRMVWELGVEHAASQLLIGGCDLTLQNEREADLGYILARHAWGLGYATEIVRALLHAGFTQLKLERIFAICEVSHRASIRVLEKSGLRRELALYAYQEAKGHYWDMYRYAVTRAEWQARGTA